MRSIFFCFTHLLQGLALKQLLCLFGFFNASVFVSGCIQIFTSASRCCRQPLRHSLSPVAALSFAHFCFSCRRLAIQSFTSPSCRHCRLLSHFVVPSSASHLFTLARRRHHRPATSLLQLLIANVDSSSS